MDLRKFLRNFYALSTSTDPMIDQSGLLDSIEQAEKRAPAIPIQMPVLPLRDIVIYPHMIFPVLIGRASSLKAVAESLERDKFILVTAQRNAATEDAGFDDIHKVGTVAKSRFFSHVDQGRSRSPDDICNGGLTCHVVSIK